MLSRKCEVSLILPAFNEARTIQKTLAEAVAYFRARSKTYEIIVAADGDDGTRELAREFSKGNGPIHVIGEAARRGKGKGIREGVLIANGDIIGFADADNKVPISEFEKLEVYFRDGYDLVIGSRGLADSRIDRKQPWYRRVGSRGFGYFMHAVVGLPDIRDTQCGFKFFRKAVAKDLFKRQRIDGYMFDVEILALAQRLNYRKREVPIIWRDDADSRLQLVSGNLRNAMDIFRIGLSCRRQVEILPEAETQARGA